MSLLKEPEVPKRTRKLSAVKPMSGPSLPKPVRVLGKEGSQMWNRIWRMHSRWISDELDLDHVTMLCESVDERALLRATVLGAGDWRDRVALRALDEQITELMGSLGLNPTERARLNVGDAPKGRLAELRAARGSGD